MDKHIIAIHEPWRLLIQRMTGFHVVLLTASGMLLLKLVMSFYVYGTNDMTSWIMFSRVIEGSGTFEVYSLISSYNHPPLISWFLKLVALIVSQTGASFAFVFRLLPILADFASVLILWKLLEVYGVRERALICVIASLDPIRFFISGFHGNTDPVFIMLTLAVVYLLEKGHVRLGGLVYGVSMSVKIVPIFLVPVFILLFPKVRSRLLFIVYTSIVLLLLWLPYFIADHRVIIQNIFQYSSLPGIWGLGHLFRLGEIGNLSFLALSEEFLASVSSWHILSFKPFFFAAVLSASFWMRRNKKLNLLDKVFFVFCLFLVMTPGFGVQYLSWFSIWAIATFPFLGALYALVGGIFLFLVYSYWGGGVPPYYANSWLSYVTMDACWGGPARYADLILWMIVVLMLAVFLLRKMPQSSSSV